MNTPLPGVKPMEGIAAIELPPATTMADDEPITELDLFSYFDLHLLQAAIEHEIAIRIAAGQKRNAGRLRILLHLIYNEIEDREVLLDQNTDPWHPDYQPDPSGEDWPYDTDDWGDDFHMVPNKEET